MTTPQKEFNTILPTQDNATPPNNLVAGQLTQLDFVVGGNTYSWPIPATTLPGAAVTVLFSATTPPFVPVAGTVYTADCFAVDSGGDGALSNSITWTQAAAVPAAPTGFGVA